MPLRNRADDESSSGHGACPSPKRKDKSFMTSLKKLLVSRLQRAAESASQLVAGSPETASREGFRAGVVVYGPPRSSASMPLLVPSLRGNQDTPASSGLPSPRFAVGGHRLVAAPSSSTVLQLPSIDSLTPPLSSSATSDRLEGICMEGSPSPSLFSPTSDLRDKAPRDPPTPVEPAAPALFSRADTERGSASQPLPQLRIARPPRGSPMDPTDADTFCEPAGSCVPPGVSSPGCAASAPSPISPLGAPPQPFQADVVSSTSSACSRGSTSCAASSSTLIAVCPGAPEAMRRPVWQLSDYGITGRVYKGEVSSVYKALCLRSNIKVALKVYSLNRVADNTVHTLVREVKIHTDLCHSAILMLYGVFEEKNRLVLVLERAQCGDLFQLHRSLTGCRMNEDQLRMLVLVPLLDALVYLHARGICHRDIKPENLLLTSGWALKVADFGAAINLAQERAVTRTGTVDYMAPEVERCPLKAAPEDNKDNPHLAYTTSADVWSVGVMAYEMLVGFPPFISCTEPGRGSAGAGAAEEEEEDDEGDGCGGHAGGARRARELSFPHFVSAGAQDFIAGALVERPGDRPTAPQLMRHPWLKHAVRQYQMRQRKVPPVPQPEAFEQQQQQQYPMLRQQDSFIMSASLGASARQLPSQLSPLPTSTLPQQPQAPTYAMRPHPHHHPPHHQHSQPVLMPHAPSQGQAQSPYMPLQHQSSRGPLPPTSLPRHASLLRPQGHLQGCDVEAMGMGMGRPVHRRLSQVLLSPRESWVSDRGIGPQSPLASSVAS